MRRKHGRGRGVSFGTIAVLCVSVLTLAVGAGIFFRISGNIEDITLDPGLLTQPLGAFTRSVIDTTPQEAPSGASSPEPTAQVAVAVPEATMASATATAAATQTAPPEPTQPPSRVLRLTAVGQVMAGEELRRSAQRDNLYDFAPILAPMGGALAADLSIATLHTGLTDTPAAFSTYSTSPALVSGLAASGVNFINLATDRVLDGGTDGLSHTLDILDRIGIAHQGGYRGGQERQQSAVLEVNGVKVAVLAYTSPISATGKKAASDADIAASTRVLSVEAAAQDIVIARSEGADIVIVLAHWGSRTDSRPSKETRETATALANAGADIILGTNPNSVHEIERKTVTDANGKSREVFIAYSLGNFLTDESRNTPDISGLVLHLTIEWDAQSQRAAISEGWYMPTWIMRYKEAGVNQYRVVPSGSSVVPDHMTDTIYANMKKSYKNTVDKLGTTYALPKEQP